MKLAALAVTAMFMAAPALAQGYGAADASNNTSAANPSAAMPASPNSNADTRVASNKHRQHQKSNSSQDSMNGNSAQATPSQDASPDASQSQSTPAPQPAQ